MTAPILTTERLILRQPAPDDWEPFCEFEISERSKSIGGPLDRATAWRVFACMLGHWAIRGYGMWTVTIKGSDTGIGMVGPWHPIEWPETEIGWVIWSDKVEGTGIAREAASAAILHAWDTLKWDTAVSYIDAANTRSIALAERLGATLDPGAPYPRAEKPCLVYRHPNPRKDRT
jgi:RimJ/RimL family protein N-acetyltransferase